MLEVVFSESAAGSLKLAQNCKKDKNILVEGKGSDVFGFHLVFSIGDIAKDGIGEGRLEVLNRLFGIYPQGKQAAEECYAGAKKQLQTIRKRLRGGGETVRLWYSSQPDELCGFYWFMTQLGQWGIPPERIFIVRLPDWEYNEKQDVVIRNSWAEVSPQEWHRYLMLQITVSQVVLTGCALCWKTLMEENAPLRIVLNGQLVSAPEDIYDSFIMREIELMENEFQEAYLIGTVIGKYRLGISDAFIALRIETMVEAGKLECITKSGEDAPTYHRMHRKKGGGSSCTIRN